MPGTARIDSYMNDCEDSEMNLKQFLSVVEIRTKIVSVSTFAIALIYIPLQGHSLSVLPTLLLFTSVLMVDMGTTAFNSFFDYMKGVDHRSLNREKEKVLVHEGVPAGAALIVAAGLFAGASLIGLYFVITRGWPVLVFGAASLLTGIFYSGGRRPISHSPLGELFAGGFLGSVLFLVIQYILTPVAGPADPLPWGLWLLLSLPSALIASLITASFAVIVLLAVLELGGLHRLSASLPVLIYVPAIIEFRKMLKRGLIQETKGPSMGGISRIFVLMTLAVLSAQLMSLLLPAA